MSWKRFGHYTDLSGPCTCTSKTYFGYLFYNQKYCALRIIFTRQKNLFQFENGKCVFYEKELTAVRYIFDYKTNTRSTDQTSLRNVQTVHQRSLSFVPVQQHAPSSLQLSTPPANIEQKDFEAQRRPVMPFWVVCE